MKERGLIPARAGKTGPAPRWSRCLPAHPRAGGENFAGGLSFGWDRGSSPRGRGKRRRPDFRRAPARLIPARAGKTRRRRCSHSSDRAHPRAGGENTLDGLVVDLATGSSPRGRGKLMNFGQRGLQRGLIPARAGKTPRSPPWGRRTPAHPRAGGENSASAALLMVEKGSSPRGRGKRRTGRR